MEKQKEKTIYELDLHETVAISTNIGGKIEITRVAGGWIYSMEYPGFKQSPVVFVPFNPEFSSPPKKSSLPTKEK